MYGDLHPESVEEYSGALSERRNDREGKTTATTRSATNTNNCTEHPQEERPSHALSHSSAPERKLLTEKTALVLSQIQKLIAENDTSTDERPVLQSLGFVLLKFFAGTTVKTQTNDTESTIKHPAAMNQLDDDRIDYRQKKRTARPGNEAVSDPMGELRDSGMPLSICSVISSLINALDPTSSDCYKSLTEVEVDLKRMLSQPEKYLFDVPPEIISNTLQFPPNKIYGRQRKWRTVWSAYSSVIVRQEESRGFLLIAGSPGSGKTSLVDKLRSFHGKEGNGAVVIVKFNAQGQEQPISTICRALDEYFERLSAQSDWEEIGLLVLQSLGAATIVLKDIIPNLGPVIGGWESLNLAHPDFEQKETYHLILQCLRRLVQTISRPTHPLLFVFDDLQWSDVTSQEVMKMLVMDEATRSVLFIGMYRNNEVGASHPLAERIRSIAADNVPMSTVNLDNLDRRSVNEFLSDVLHLPLRLTRPLADVLHTKTAGNPMFVRKLTQSLFDEGLLQYSASARRWVWDVGSITSKDVADNAVDLLLGMMEGYGLTVRWLLQVASRLGPRFDTKTILFLAVSMNVCHNAELQKCIEIVVDDGIIVKDGPNGYRFSHDQIWQAASSLTPDCERSMLHLSIGRALHQQVSQSDIDTFLFTIVDQLNRGVSIVNDHAEQLIISDLNLRAGQKALAAFSFLQASMYLLQGCTLIQLHDWNTNYRLCLNLFTTCAEVQLALGK